MMVGLDISPPGLIFICHSQKALNSEPELGIFDTITQVKRKHADHGQLLPGFLLKNMLHVVREGSIVVDPHKVSMGARLQSEGSQDKSEEASARGTQLDVGSGTGRLNGTTGGTGGRAASAAGVLVGCRKEKRVSGRAPRLRS